ncbi:hypothetical protein EMCRGX_G024523 [Ephydatia muelleri]
MALQHVSVKELLPESHLSTWNSKKYLLQDAPVICQLLMQASICTCSLSADTFNLPPLNTDTHTHTHTFDCSKMVLQLSELWFILAVGRTTALNNLLQCWICSAHKPSDRALQSFSWTT